jgi:hypothetical protein
MKLRKPLGLKEDLVFVFLALLVIAVVIPPEGGPFGK